MTVGITPTRGIVRAAAGAGFTVTTRTVSPKLSCERGIFCENTYVTRCDNEDDCGDGSDEGADCFVCKNSNITRQENR